jgi:hypothetical protein
MHVEFLKDFPIGRTVSTSTVSLQDSRTESYETSTKINILYIYIPYERNNSVPCDNFKRSFITFSLYTNWYT